MSKSELNSYLKKIADLSWIKEIPPFHLARHPFMAIEFLLKYKQNVWSLLGHIDSDYLDLCQSTGK